MTIVISTLAIVTAATIAAQQLQRSRPRQALRPVPIRARRRP